MKKTAIKILRIILLLLVIILALLATVNLPITNFRHQESDTDYSGWMGETLSADQKIIDVAMLGAHDAFTGEMNLFSRIDEASADQIQTGTTGFLIKGFSLKQSKTQVSGVKELLENGIRYFDVRLSYDDRKDMWYTSHTYYSSEFSGILADTLTFLEDNPGEFLIFDLQHIYGVDYDDADDMNEILDLFTDSGILEYVYLTKNKNLEEVTYADITANKTKGGIIILTKFTPDNDYFWQYGASINSAWGNSDSSADIFQFLDAQAEMISSGNAMTGNQLSDNPYEIDSRRGFRVMQAVLTIEMSSEGIIEAMRTWSLLERAKSFNNDLIDHPDFSDWLAQMPIVMVDYADTNKSEFLDEIMDLIMEYDENLSTS